MFSDVAGLVKRRVIPVVEVGFPAVERDFSLLLADGTAFSDVVKTIRSLNIPEITAIEAIDASKLESELGWRAQENFESGIRKTVQWYLANPEWVHSVTSGEYRQWMQQQYGTKAAA